MNYRILLVDDNKLDIETTLGEFAGEGDMEFSTAQTAEDALALVKRSPDAFAVILLDYNLAGTTGDKTAKDLLAINSRLNIVILSGDTTRAAAINTLKAGAVDFIDKNLPPEDKITAVRGYCRKFDEVTRVVAFEADGSTRAKIISDAGLITGRSKALAEVAQQILRIKDSSSTALVRGESGTGKEVVARAIHDRSARKGKAFVPINCGAIPEALIESELFGHEKGAFTGALTKKIGKFQLAHGGTIFLDEIGEMPLNMQVRLLRVLQEGTIDTIGGRMPIPVDVRVVAATNRDLEEAVKKGQFREDLYYRLNVIPFHIPPLRERKEDIEPLISYFVRNHPTGSNKKFLYSTLKYFLEYPWRGNVRELENTIDRVLTLTPEEYISPRHLEPKFFGSHASGLDFDCDWQTFLDQKKERENELDRKFLSYHLTKHKSVRDLAKSKLKMPKSTLQTRINELGIDAEELTKSKEEEYA